MHAVEAPHVLAGRILVVHEDAAFTRAVRRELHDAGFFVVEQNAPEHAIVSILRGDEYDLILFNVPGHGDVATGLYQQLAGMSTELASRMVFLAHPSVPLPGSSPRIAKPIDVAALRDWIAEFVTLRTQPPCSVG